MVYILFSDIQTSEYQVGNNTAFLYGVRETINEPLCPVLVTTLQKYV